MSTYQVTTPSGQSFSVVAGDSDLAVMAANAEAKRLGIPSCRAALTLDQMDLGDFNLSGAELKKPAGARRKPRPVFDTTNFSTIGWHRYNDAGVPSGYSKRHLFEEGEETTLCGQPLPDSMAREIDDGSLNGEDCKACARAATKKLA